MCGLEGVISSKNVVNSLLHGLKKMEYRGYDSAGIALTHNNGFICSKAVGKVAVLENKINKEKYFSSNIGIAHTRWATHGAPSEANAHPLISKDNKIAIVHNGIIENYSSLKKDLINKGYEFVSNTDTEVILNYIHYYVYAKFYNILEAIHATINLLHGAYALGICFIKEPNKLYAVRQGSPLLIGIGTDSNYISSDSIAISDYVNEIIYMKDEDIAVIDTNNVHIYNKNLTIVQRDRHKVKKLSNKDKNLLTGYETEDFSSFMRKEIFCQPTIFRNLLSRCTQNGMLKDDIFGKSMHEIFDQVQLVHIVACGSSFHAALLAKNWIEKFSGIPCWVELASEYRAKKAVVLDNSLFIALSQSGETADVLASLKVAKKFNYKKYLAITNTKNNTLSRETDVCFHMNTGLEIGVAATKTFTAQLISLYLLAIAISKAKTSFSVNQEVQLIDDLSKIPVLCKQILNAKFEKKIASMAQELVMYEHILFIGRGDMWIVALEGALKLKELSYIHAEAYPGGELKHGPLALIDETMPTIALLPNNELFEKTNSNVQEILARNGKVFVLSDNPYIKDNLNNIEQFIFVPEIQGTLSSIIYVIALQLLAKHISLLRGCNVDQPRNLAKSVTVE